MLLGYLLVVFLVVTAIFAGAFLAGGLFNGAQRARIVAANRDEPRLD